MQQSTASRCVQWREFRVRVSPRTGDGAPLLRKLRTFAANLNPRIRIGRGTHLALTATIKPGSGRIEIGSKCLIRPYAVLMTYGGSIVIGDRVSINPFSVLYGHGGLRIGSDVLIAAHVTIIPANHIFERTDVPMRQQGETRLGITIGDDVWIGSGARILDGVTVGKGSVVAAGAVVRDDVPAYGIVGGVPARLLRSRDRTAPTATLAT